MPVQDEFGGVPVDAADEFGGVPVDEREEGSLYTPEEGARLQAEAEQDAWKVPETVSDSPLDVIQKPLAKLVPRFNRHTVPDALDVLDSLSPERFLAPPGVIAPDDLSTPSREPTPAEQVATGALNAAGNAVNSFTSPVGIATLGVGALPRVAQAGVTALFLGQTAEQTAEAAKAAGEASVTGTPEEKAEAYGNLGLQPVMGAMIGHAGAKLLQRPRVPVPGAPIPVKPFEAPPPEPEPAPAPEPEPVPTVQKTVGPDGNPVEVLEINRKKKTALVRPEGQADAPPSVVKLSELETKEVPAEQPKEPNASSEPEAATPDGDVRAQPESSKPEVPAEESGGGVLTEADRGVRQAEAKAGEVSLTELAPEEKALTDAATESNRQQGLDSDVELVADEPKKGESSDIAYVENGKIKINVPEFRKWLTRIPPEQRATAVESLLNEEGIHLSVRKALGDSAVGELWKSLTKTEQNLVKRSYFGKGWKTAEALSDAQFGHEYIRRVLQWGMRMDPREVAGARGKGFEWLTQKGIDVALKGIDVARRSFGTEAGRNVKAMLDRVEQNLNAAKGSIPGGEKLSAKSPQETRDEVARMSSQEFVDWAKAQKGGFTSTAYELGKNAPSQEFVDSLRTEADRLDHVWRDHMKSIQAEPDMNRKMAMLNELGGMTGQKQFFEEAWQYATGTGSGGESARAAGNIPKFKAATLEEKLSAKNPVRKVVDDLNNKRRALGTIWSARANRKIMDQTIDAADNKANIVGQQMGNRVKLGTDKIQREAALAVVEANGNPGRLADFLTKARAGNNRDAVAAVQYAQANWARLQPTARRVKSILDSQISQEQNAGISTEYRDAYVPHIYDRDLLMGSGRPFVIAGGTGMGSGFKKGRTFENIFDAIEAGYTPKTLDVAELVEHRVKVGQKIINRKDWAESLRGLNDPTDGNPLSAPLQRRSRGPGQPGYEVAPPGYSPVEILPGVRTGIHEAYLPLFRALTGESFVSGSVPGKVLLEAAGGIKHGLLVFDSFHASRIFQKLLTLAPGQVLTGRAGYKRGQSLLEFTDADLTRAEADRLITPEISNWVRANRANANLLLDSGLNVGRIQEGLYNSVVRQIPGLGTFNKWVFEKLTRGALMEAGLIELERVSAAKPGVPRGTIAQQVSRDLNAYFGNLGRQGIFKSKSAQDIARLVALAPQWVESMARTELKGSAQAVKGLTYDPIVHKRLLVGTIGKGVAQGLLAYFVGTQLLNYITRGHSTFQNPEENHKLDAWIPDVTGKSHGFFLSPFSVVAEITHDMIRYSSKEPTAMEAATRIASNKASPMFRAGKVLLTGRDYDGKQITDTWKRIKAAAFALAPTPIPLAPMIKGSAYPGQTQRQLTASAGFKTEPAESATQQIVDKAKRFLIDTGKKKPILLEASDEPSYNKLRDLLRKEDEKGARALLEELRKSHSAKNILFAMRNHVRRPFTGSKRDEIAFRNSLNPREREIYDKARDEQRQEYQKFLEIWYNKP